MTPDEMEQLLLQLRKDVERLESLYGAFFGPNAIMLREAANTIMKDDRERLDRRDGDVVSLRVMLGTLRRRVTALEAKRKPVKRGKK